jgi:hypothetical protein
MAAHRPHAGPLSRRRAAVKALDGRGADVISIVASLLLLEAPISLPVLRPGLPRQL